MGISGCHVQGWRLIPSGEDNSLAYKMRSQDLVHLWSGVLLESLQGEGAHAEDVLLSGCFRGAFNLQVDAIDTEMPELTFFLGLPTKRTE